MRDTYVRDCDEVLHNSSPFTRILSTQHAIRNPIRDLNENEIQTMVMHRERTLLLS